MNTKKMPSRLQRYIIKERPRIAADVKPLSICETIKEEEKADEILPEIALDIRPIILFVIQKQGYDPTKKTFCGIGLRGKLTLDILKSSTKYNFLPCPIDNIEILKLYIKKFTPRIIIYNYHIVTTPWLNNNLGIIFPNIVHIFIHYDLTQKMVDATKSNDTFHYLITDDDTLEGNDYVFIVARSMPFIDESDCEEKKNEKLSHIPKIGYQGFGFPHKGIDKIANQVCKEFSEAVIRLHIPFSLYGDPNGSKAMERVNEVKRIITGTNIQLEVSHEFKNDHEIIGWLKENDVNCYFYDFLDGAGIASSPDYAIAARKPIAITRSHQFRHMWHLKPSICIETNTLKDIINNGIEPLKLLYEKYTHLKVIKDYENICDTIYNK